MDSNKNKKLNNLETNDKKYSDTKDKRKLTIRNGKEISGKFIDHTFVEKNKKKSSRLAKIITGVVSGVLIAGAITTTAIVLSSTKEDSMPTISININIDEIYTNKEISVGDKISSIPVKEVDGYQFLGWFKDENFTEPFLADDVITVDAVIYGKYVPKYTIEFPESCEGYTIVAEGNEVVCGENYSFEIKLSDGYTKSSIKVYLIRGEESREELFLSADGKYIVENVESNCSIEVEGVELNEYSVTFKNGKDVLKTETVVHDDFAIGNGIELTKEHHNFIGWSISEDKNEIIDLLEYKIKEDTTFYAKFEQIQYKVGFVSGDLDLSEYDFTYGSGEYLPEDLLLPTPNPEKESTSNYFYTFKGWALTENGEVITDFSQVQIVGNTTFYAVFTENSFINLYLNIDSENTCYKLYESANALEYIASLQLELTDKDYCGWFLDEELTIPLTNEHTITEDFNLFTKRATVDVLSNGSIVSANGYNEPISEIIFSLSAKEITNHWSIDCTEITSVFIPANVTKIGEGAFSHCEKLQKVQITNGLKTIENLAFNDCGNISQIKIPASVTSIGVSALSSVQQEIIVDNNNEHYTSIDGILYDKNVTSLIACPKKVSSCVIPETVQTIGTEAFKDCAELSSITFATNITKIETSAFAGCTKLTSVTFRGDNKWRVGDNKRIYLPTDLTNKSKNANLLTSYTDNWEILSLKENELLITFKVSDGVDYYLIEYIANRGNNIAQYIATLDTGLKDKDYCGWFLDEKLMDIIPSDMTFTEDLTLYTRKSTYSEFLTIDKNGCLTACQIPSESGSVMPISAQSSTDDSVVVLPLGVKSIADGVFGFLRPNYRIISNVILSSSVESISAKAFGNSLFAPSIPIYLHSGITNIDTDNCFSYASKDLYVSENNPVYSSVDGILYSKDKTKLLACPTTLDVCNVDEKIKEINVNMFSGLMMSIGQINVSENNEYYSSVNGVLYNKDKTKLIVYPRVPGEEFIVPDSVLEISENAFLTSVCKTITLPAGIKKIGKGAFLKVTQAINITFNDCEGWCVSQTSDGADAIAISSSDLSDPAKAAEYLVKSHPDGYSDWYWIKNDVVNVNVVVDGVDNNINLVENFSALDLFKGGNILGLSKDNCIGLYLDNEFITPVNQSTNITNGLILYTKSASLDKITISSNGQVDCVDKNIEGEVTLPMAATKIKAEAFNGCKNITSVIIPSGITEISYATFMSCTKLQSVKVVGDGQLNKIGMYSFYNCTSLSDFEIPSSVTIIESNAFYHAAFTEINIPSSVITIGKGVFVYCANLTNINVDSNNANYCSENGVLFNKNKTSLMIYPSGKNDVTTYSIPSTVETIDASAFAYCSHIQSVTIPNGVKTIESNAFTWTGLSGSIYIPASVEVLSGDVFQGAGGITSITVDENNAYFSSLEGILYNKEKTVLIKCGRFLEKSEGLVIPEGVEVIEDWAFYGCNNIQSWTLPSTLKTIEENAFNLCLTMTSIVIPSSVTHISREAFAGCNNLNSVTFEDSSNWFIADTANATDGTDLDSEALSNVSTASTYLKTDYVSKYWIKKQINQ